MKLIFNKRPEGIILVEVLLAAALLGVILAPLLNFLVTGAESTWFASCEIRAQALARESLEALRSVRERNWEELKNGTFYAAPAAGIWRLVAAEEGENVGPFNRKVRISPVYRDADDQIVEEGGRLDPSTKRVAINLFWHTLRDRSLSLTTYLTRYLENLIWTQTTQAEFDQGEKEYVETTLVYDGEVQLEGGCGQNPSGAWIYNEGFQNTWAIHPSAANNIQEVTQPPGQVYEGKKALEIYSFSGADTKIRNRQSICTLGFTRLEFYAYNSATVKQSFEINGKWEGAFVEVVLPPQSWQFVSIPYAKVSGGNEINLNFIFFKGKNYQVGTKFYLDNMTLRGGVGGYYQRGTLTSSVFDAGRETTFNRIAYQASSPLQTSIGFQVATTTSPDGPWIFYGPGGTTNESDLYTNPEGQGIWLGNNFGRYLRYKVYLFSDDGKNTPVLYEVSLNYAP